MMLPRKEIVDRAFENGTINKVNELLSAAHILNLEANTLVEEAADTLASAGLHLGDLKKLHSDFVRCADRYFREFATMVTTEKKKMDMFTDMDSFDKMFREWAKIER